MIGIPGPFQIGRNLEWMHEERRPIGGAALGTVMLVRECDRLARDRQVPRETEIRTQAGLCFHALSVTSSQPSRVNEM